MITLNIRADLKGLTRDLTALERTQIPYATALALTATAKAVQAGETAALDEVFDKPTPFTERAFGVKAATKATQTAIVFAKDIQAAYLEPFAEGNGRQQLRGRVGLPVPKNLATNAYGNLPRGAIARLKARPNVFFGTVQTKSGQTISGIWQRPSPVAAGRRGKRKGKAQRGGLKLLIRWTSGTEVHQNLHYRERAELIVRAAFGKAFGPALARAVATIKR